MVWVVSPWSLFGPIHHAAAATGPVALPCRSRLASRGEVAGRGRRSGWAFAACLLDHGGLGAGTDARVVHVHAESGVELFKLGAAPRRAA
jgi:hypothetical protein